MIGSLIAAGASLLGTHLVNRQNMRNYYEMRQYNTPAAQMQRFRNAGLNPHLIYTQTNETSPAPEMKIPDFSSLGNMTSELSEFQNIKESKARVNNLDKVNQQLDEQIKTQVLENVMRQKNIDWQDLFNSANYETVKQNIENAKKQFDLLDEQIKKVTREIERLDMNDFVDLMNVVFKSKELDNAARSLGIEEAKLKEMIREFNINNKYKVLLNDFLNGLLGDGSDTANAVGATIRQWLLSFMENEYERNDGQRSSDSQGSGGSF